MQMMMLNDESAVVINISSKEKKIAEYFLNYLNQLTGVAVSVTAEPDGSLRIVISRRSYGVALDLLDGLYCSDPSGAQKLVGMYNLILTMMMRDAEDTNIKSILRVIQGGKKDED